MSHHVLAEWQRETSPWWHAARAARSRGSRDGVGDRRTGRSFVIPRLGILGIRNGRSPQLSFRSEGRPPRRTRRESLRPIGRESENRKEPNVRVTSVMIRTSETWRDAGHARLPLSTSVSRNERKCVQKIYWKKKNPRHRHCTKISTVFATLVALRDCWWLIEIRARRIVSVLSSDGDNLLSRCCRREIRFFLVKLPRVRDRRNSSSR